MGLGGHCPPLKNPRLAPRGFFAIWGPTGVRCGLVLQLSEVRCWIAAIGGVVAHGIGFGQGWAPWVALWLVQAGLRERISFASVMAADLTSLERV